MLMKIKAKISISSPTKKVNSNGFLKFWFEIFIVLKCELKIWEEISVTLRLRQIEASNSLLQRITQVGHICTIWNSEFESWKEN